MPDNPISRCVRKMFISNITTRFVLLLGTCGLIIVVERCLQDDTNNPEMTFTTTGHPARVPLIEESASHASDLLWEPAEVKHVAFLKVHKAGSSTTQNIFLRFGVDRNLTFLLASIEHNECGGFSNCISYYNTLTDNNTWPPPANKNFEIMCSHVIFNKNSFRKYLPKDTRFIGIVREPIARLESAISFFGLLKNIPLSDFASNPTQYNHAMMNNRMAFEFGFNKELLPNMSTKHLPDSEHKEALDHIDLLNKEFTLILVAERYEESLVLMKRMLNWTTKDIVYIYRGKQRNRQFATDDKIKLKEYLYLDYLLYNYAVKELDRKIALTGADFVDEVHDFHNIIEKVVSYCLLIKSSRQRQTLIINASAWHEEFSIVMNDCETMNKPERKYIDEIRTRQYGLDKIAEER